MENKPYRESGLIWVSSYFEGWMVACLHAHNRFFCHVQNGILQTDEHTSYNTTRTRQGIIGIGYGIHIRRKFVDAASLSKGSPLIAPKTIDLTSW